MAQKKTEFLATWDQDQLKPWVDRGVDKAIKRAVKFAGRDALRTLNTEAARYVKSRKKIKAGRISKAMKKINATGSEIRNMEWRLRVTGKQTPMSYYPHSKTRGKTASLRVAINVGKKANLGRAFVARMTNVANSGEVSTHDGIFVRTSKKRFPIKELFSTKVTDPFFDKGATPEMLHKSMVTFSATFDRVFPRLLAGEKLGVKKSTT